MTISALLKQGKTLVMRRSPELLVGIGIVGLITSTVVAVKATPQALNILEEIRNISPEDEIPKTEIIKATWKCYVPSLILIATSTACIIGASSINFRRNAALAASYQLAQNTLNHYQHKVVESIGVEEEAKIREQIAQSRVTPMAENTEFILGDGEYRCYEPISGRSFPSSYERIRSQINNINERLLQDDFVSIDDWYDELGLSHTKGGSDVGWHIDKGQLKVTYSSILSENKIPCLALDYDRMPSPYKSYYGVYRD